MAKKSPNQVSSSCTESTILEDHLSVHYWRNELNRRFNRFDSLARLAEALAERDSLFAGRKGYFQVVSAHRGRASLIVTSKIVRLIDQILEAESPTTSSTDRLKRQGLVRKPY